MANSVVSRVGISPVGSGKYRVNRLRFHLLAYSIARQSQLKGSTGKFIIRCDDTDIKLSNRSFFDSYMEVLADLGIKADLDPYTGDSRGNSLYQSERGQIYSNHLQILEEKGLLLHDSNGAILFDTHRFSILHPSLLEDNKLSIQDAGRGITKVDIRSQTRDKDGRMENLPFPLVRADGSYLFHLTSPVDDGDLGVTHVVRDRDKLDLVAKHEMIRIALGFPPITYIHAPLLVKSDGTRFTSDEHYGDSTFQDFISRGILPSALVSYLMSGLCGPSEKYYKDIDEFAMTMNLSNLHRANVTFSPAVLELHNKKALKNATFDEYKEGLRSYLEWSSPNLLNKLSQYPNIEHTLHKLGRSFKDSTQFINDITFEGREDIEPNLQRALDLVLSLDHSEVKSYYNFFVENAALNADSLSLSFPDYCRALTYALVGKMTEVSLRDAVSIYEAEGSIQKRLDNAIHRER